MSRINYTCARCGNPILSPNRLKKYCCDECALEAHRAQCRERAKRHYYANLEQERAQSRARYAVDIEKSRAYFREYQREYYYKRKELKA